MLRSGLGRYSRLLDALDVAELPGASAATDVLIELTHTIGARRAPDPAALEVVNSCWKMLVVATEDDLARLAGKAVVPVAGGRLRTVDEVLLEDVPGAERWLTSAARARLVSLDPRQHAFERAGVKRLSQQRRGEVVVRTEPLPDHWIENRLRERRLQLARIVAGEGGDWHGVVALTQRLEVVAVGALTARYSLEGFPRCPRIPPSTRVLSLIARWVSSLCASPAVSQIGTRWPR